MFFGLFLGLSMQSFGSQSASKQLNFGDSLFNEKRYSEAFEQYQEILDGQQQVSDAMLLKMA